MARHLLSVSAAAAEAPRRAALVVDRETLSYGDLTAAVAGRRSALEAQGLDRPRPAPAERTPSHRVAVVAATDLSTVVTLLALVELGTPPVLVHPRWTQPERRRRLAEAAPLLSVDPDVDRRPPPAVGGEMPRLPALPDDGRAMAIVSTSGTSGGPRWVVLSRRAFAASARASRARLGWRPDDRWLLSLPLAHVGGLSILTRCLTARGTMVLGGGGAFDPESIVERVADGAVTLLSLVPTQLRRLLDLRPRWRPPGHLRAILLGGAAAPPGLVAEAAGRGYPLRLTYGLTEACSQVATEDASLAGGRTRSCGRPLPGFDLRLAAGGAIQLRGEPLMNGYLPAPAVDLAPLDRPFDDGGWLTTGDLGRLDEAGRLHILGRADDVIVTGGENVHPLEVERVLEEHPAIREACVFGVADAEWGQRVAALLVAESNEPQDDDLLRHLGGRLASFKQPRRVRYVRKLPRGPQGKLDRRAPMNTKSLRPLGE